MLDLYDEVNSSDSEVHIKQQTKAIIESPRKFNSDEEIIKDVVVAKKSTKNLKEKLVDEKPQKNVKATKKSVKSSDEEKENIFKETNETQNKAKKQAAEKNTKLKPTDNKDKANLDVSPKQKKLNENTVQKIRLTKNKNENNDINNRTEGNKLLDNRKYFFSFISYVHMDLINFISCLFKIIFIIFAVSAWRHFKWLYIMCLLLTSVIFPCKI